MQAVNRGNVQHVGGWHGFKVGWANPWPGLARVVLVAQVAGGAAPAIQLHALADATAGVVVFDGHKVRLQQLKAVGHGAAMHQAGGRANHLLGKGLAIAQPGISQHALGLGPVQAAGYLWPLAPLPVQGTQGGGVFGVDAAVFAPGLGLNANAGCAHDVVYQGAQHAPGDVVVALQIPRVVAQGHCAALGQFIGAGVLAGVVFAQAAGLGGIVVRQHAPGLGAAHGGLGVVQGDKAI